MKWKNTLRDGVPDHSREVVIAVNGIYHIAYFHHQAQEFQIIKDGRRTALPAKKTIIYWAEIQSHERGDF